ncbi:MAG TPA: DUF1059 domain-containing protein [Dehalococcoidia bacterium]|nr:DUF1059 domain-containing protein [Dehalococcoidia bacterium]
MVKTVACHDDGEFPDCPVVVRGATEEEVIDRAKEHGRQAHGMTDEQLRDPAVAQGIRGYIREA